MYTHLNCLLTLLLHGPSMSSESFSPKQVATHLLGNVTAPGPHTGPLVAFLQLARHSCCPGHGLRVQETLPLLQRHTLQSTFTLSPSSNCSPWKSQKESPPRLPPLDLDLESSSPQLSSSSSISHSTSPLLQVHSRHCPSLRSYMD